MDNRDAGGLRALIPHIVFILAVLALWEWAASQKLLNPAFFGHPGGIWKYLWENLFASPKLIIDFGWTALGTLSAFVLGSVCAVAVALMFVMYPKVEHFLEPYFSALNAMPRIALAPLFILWFGLGVGSKIAVGFSLTFFIVLSSTVAGIRGVNQDHVTLSRTLGATPSQLFFLVTLPGAVPVIFSGLRLGLIYALLGVVGGEIIASEHGLGQTLSYLSSTFHIDGVFALLLLLSLLGVAVVRGMTRLEKYLLRWQ
jgi:NitT/TauT family transport system permease protein